MKTLILALCLAGLCAVSPNVAQAVDGDVPEIDRIFPPCVVTTEPMNREKDVDPAVTQIKVTFDRPMKTGTYSWITYASLGVYPGYRGSAMPHWEDGDRTCVMPVKLQPGTVYAVGVNSFRHTGFRDPDDKVAVPCVWVFKTKAAE